MPSDQPDEPAAVSLLRTPSRWLPAAALIVVSGGLELGGDAFRAALRFDRDGLAAGQFWRVVSGHLVHLGWGHYLLNAAGVALVWLLVGARFGARSWAVILVGIAAGVSAGLWFLDRQLAWYVGLSGVLHGLLCAGLIAGLGGGRADRVESLLLGAIVLFKLGYEQLLGPLPGSEAGAGGDVVVNAHLYGAAAGAGLGWLAGVRAGRSLGI